LRVERRIIRGRGLSATPLGLPAEIIRKDWRREIYRHDKYEYVIRRVTCTSHYLMLFKEDDAANLMMSAQDERRRQYIYHIDAAIDFPR